MENDFFYLLLFDFHTLICRISGWFELTNIYNMYIKMGFEVRSQTNFIQFGMFVLASLNF